LESATSNSLAMTITRINQPYEGVGPLGPDAPVQYTNPGRPNVRGKVSTLCKLKGEKNVVYGAFFYRGPRTGKAPSPEHLYEGRGGGLREGGMMFNLSTRVIERKSISQQTRQTIFLP